MPQPFNPTVRVVEGDLPQDVSDTLSAEGQIAVDIETSGLDWRTDTIGTVQLYAPTQGTILVHNLMDNPARLLTLLRSQSAQKVFHHAPFDLSFIKARWAADVDNVRCTKIASKLLDPRLENRMHSLGPLLSRQLGVSISKGAVRTSDWQALSLSEEQLSYAANDVRYLLPLIDRLSQALATHGRLALYEECCRFLPAHISLVVDDFPDVFSY